MNPFLDLSTQVERAWQKAGQSPEAFPALATRILNDFVYTLSADEFNAAIADWLLASGPLPEQIQLHNVFGQPPITLFNNKKFLVEVYIWQNFDTSLHSHGFRGAFRVLHGRSLHEEYRPTVIEQVAEDVQITRLGEPTRTFLEEGYVGTIAPGQELTHRVIHLENPTVTLCIKTINENDLFQWNYFANGLAIQKRNLPPRLFKSMYYFDYLLKHDEDRAADFLGEILAALPISTTMNLYEEVALSGLDLEEETRHVILESIADTYAEQEWFALYQGANLGLLTELDFSGCDSPAGRLAGHLINIDSDSGWEGDRTEAVLSLIESPNLFHVNFGEDEIDEIKTLVLNPARTVPEHLPAAQIQKLRAFLAAD